MRLHNLCRTFRIGIIVNINYQDYIILLENCKQRITERFIVQDKRSRQDSNLWPQV